MNWQVIGWGAGCIVALAAVVIGIGAALPAHHLSSVEEFVPAEPQRVAHFIRNVQSEPTWRPGVTEVSVNRCTPRETEYVEKSGYNAIAMTLVEEIPNQRFRSTITDESLPFGGYWILTLSPQRSGTNLRIEEHGVIRNPLFRFVSRFVMGHDATIRKYAESLKLALDSSYRERLWAISSPKGPCGR